jgi:hypothetical protein
METHMTTNAAPPPPRFHAISLSVAAVAAVATLGTNSAMLPAPAMFLGWVAFDLAGPWRRSIIPWPISWA